MVASVRFPVDLMTETAPFHGAPSLHPASAEIFSGVSTIQNAPVHRLSQNSQNLLSQKDFGLTALVSFFDSRQDRRSGAK